jgi:outer membrane protein OmpA-like peptidoglycan-associated protein
MKRLLRPTLAALGLAALGSVAHANVEVGGTAGIHVFSQTNELGVPDVEDAPSMRNSALFGLRVGVMFNDMIGIEGEIGVIPTESRTLVFDIWNLTYRAHLIAQFVSADPAIKLVPFALAGGGAMTVVDSKNTDVIAKDTDAMLYVGVGAKYLVDNGWGLRADARLLFPPSSAGNGPTIDFEALLSIYKEFGRKEVEKVVVAEAPRDSDGDGITDDLDKCPMEPEDMDGFQDEDGCPDLDNDKDGIPDTIDRCPMKPGPLENGGCPDEDKDGDGIIDRLDPCPDQAGPKENHGCPDPDRDNDGIPDRVDVCPDEPGVKEERGCAKKYKMVVVKKDKIEIKKQIKFASGSAKIIGVESFTILDDVAQVLRDMPTIKKVRIEGHTDSLGKDLTNLRLSQARADAVMAQLLKRGIDPGRMEAVGYGEEKPIASNGTAKGRAENRRTEFNIVEQ